MKATARAMGTKSVTGITNHRLEACCDGVVAISITLLVLEIKVPNIEYSDASALKFISCLQ